MKHIFMIFAACLVATALFAEWSADPANPTLIAGFTGEQVMPKVAIAPNGNTYICRFDTQSGAYQVFLNLLDMHGNHIWTDPLGLLISSHDQMTWLTEYDLDVDPDGNAVIVFQDIRNAGVNNVVAYKISPAGEFLWGADGIALSNDTNMDYGNMSPVCFCSADGSSYFAWQRMGTYTTIVINRLSAAGQKLWGENGITLSPAEGSYTWPQIIQGVGNDILLKLYHDTGPYWSPTRHIWVVKGTPEGTFPWTAAATEAGGITAWQQLIPFASDGAGGAVLAWYEDRDQNMDNDVYCQRIAADGSASMGMNGSLVSVSPQNQQYYPQVAVDAGDQQVYVFYRETDADQNNAGIARQLLDFSGNRLWGDTGPAIINIGPANANTVEAYNLPQGAVLLYEYGSHNLYASCWDSAGGNPWTQGSLLVANSAESKYHFDHGLHADNWCVLAWEQGSSAMDVAAMRINGNGSLGAQYLPPRNLFAELQPPDVVVLSWQPPSPYIVPDQYYIYMNNELAQVVEGGILIHTLSGLGGGTYEFYVKARYGDHYSDPSNAVVITVVSVDDPTVPAVELAPRLTPNPFSAPVRLSFDAPKGETQARVCIYNAKGQKLSELQRSLDPGCNEIRLDPASLGLGDSGVYFFRIQIGTRTGLVKGLFIR